MVITAEKVLEGGEKIEVIVDNMEEANHNVKMINKELASVSFVKEVKKVEK